MVSSSDNSEPAQYLQIRRANIISNEEWDGMVEEMDPSGSKFRLFFMSFIGFIILLLVGLKYFRDFGLGVSEELLEKTYEDRAIRFDPELEKHYKALKLDSEYRQLLAIGTGNDINETMDNDEGSDSDTSYKHYSDDETSTVARLRLEQRIAKHRLRKKLEENFDKHQTEQGQLVSCGKSCKNERDNVNIAYNTLVSQVDRELYSLLFDDTITKTEDGELIQKRTQPTTSHVKQKYKEKLLAIYETEKDPELKEMALAELKDAYDILISDRARTYYHLYGSKPPEQMKRTDPRHGGWGHELALRTFRNRMVFDVLDGMESDKFEWLAVFCLLFFGFFLPMLIQLPALYRMSGDVERRHEQLAELTRKNQERKAAERERNRQVS